MKEPISNVCASHLEHLPCDELMTRLTLNTKMDLVVLLTVGGTIPERRETNEDQMEQRKAKVTHCLNLLHPVVTADMSHLLADVLPGQHFVAGLTLKAAQMPLSVQR